MDSKIVEKELRKFFKNGGIERKITVTKNYILVYEKDKSNMYKQLFYFIKENNAIVVYCSRLIMNKPDGLAKHDPLSDLQKYTKFQEELISIENLNAVFTFYNNLKK